MGKFIHHGLGEFDWGISGLSNSPDSIGGLLVWLKADTLGGTYADGATITSWPDSSPNGNNFTAVGAPKYRATGLNGHPSVSGATTADYLSLAI